MKFTSEGWPKYVKDMDQSLRDLNCVLSELSVHHGMLVRGSRIVVPNSMRDEMLKKIHDRHLGITKCLERSKSSVWWPRIRSAIKKIVTACQHCEQKRPSQRKEPLITTTLPQRAFQKVAADLCEQRPTVFDPH